MAKIDPFLSLDCARVEGVGRNPRKGRDQILPSGNLGIRVYVESGTSIKPPRTTTTTATTTTTTTTTAAIMMMSPTVSLDPDRYDGNYPATNAITDGKRDNRDPMNYWCGKHNSASSFVIDLGSPVMVHTVYIRNSHNGGISIRGSKGMKIMLGNSNTGPWMQFYSGELENPIPIGYVFSH